ncbi:MAG: hypothetical protein Q9185_005178 [Variospora sp. 1 TL-2023]
MKLAVFIAGFVEAVPLLFANAHPTDNQRPRNQVPVLSSHILKPIGSPSFGSDESSSSRASSSSRFLRLLKPKKPAEFRCHTYPEDDILGELAAYITTFLKSYSDEIFSHKGDPDRIPFHTCFAGYAPDHVSPAIYFSSMNKRQLERVKKLLSSQVTRRFPHVRVVTTGNAIALVQQEAGQIKRRATI